MTEYYLVVRTFKPNNKESFYYDGTSIEKAQKRFNEISYLKDKYTKSIELREYVLDDVKWNLKNVDELIEAINECIGYDVLLLR